MACVCTERKTPRTHHTEKAPNRKERCPPLYLPRPRKKITNPGARVRVATAVAASSRPRNGLEKAHQHIYFTTYVAGKRVLGELLYQPSTSTLRHPQYTKKQDTQSDMRAPGQASRNRRQASRPWRSHRTSRSPPGPR